MIVQLVRRVVLLGAAALGAALALSACTSSGANSPPASSSSSSSQAAVGGAAGGPSGPGASGTVAAISGTTMQVQNQQTGQVAVAWTASTKFSHQVTASLSDVQPGDCVAAVAPSGTDTSAKSFTATTLTISPAVNGDCTGGAGRPTGGPFTGAPPSGFPSGRLPSGVPSGQNGRTFGSVASGKVTSASGSTIVIAARQPGSTSTTSKTVTVDAKTKITTEAATTSKSLKVGKCVTAQGKADSTGTVKATSVRITNPTNGQCGLFFVGRGPGDTNG